MQEPRRKSRDGQDAQERVSSRREYETPSVKDRWKVSEAERKYGQEADQTDNVRHLCALYAHGSWRCGLCGTINFPNRVKRMQHSCSGNYNENFGEWFTHEQQVTPDTILGQARKRGKTSKSTRERRLAKAELPEFRSHFGSSIHLLSNTSLTSYRRCSP